MIGVFDSGLGGLTVLKEIKKVLPEHDLIYLGDTAHVPYGNRSHKMILQLTEKAVDFLFSKGADHIVVACNTASAKALPELRKKYKNISGVIDPVVEYFAKRDFDRIGLIGTRATVNSGIYDKKIKNSQISHESLNKTNVEVDSVATPLLVPLVEEGWIDEVETLGILKKYLKMLKLRKVQAMILGCTHYPLLINQIKKEMGENCFIPNPAEIVAKDLINKIKNKDLILTQGKIEYFVTELTENFQNVANNFLGEEIKLNEIEI